MNSLAFSYSLPILIYAEADLPVLSERFYPTRYLAVFPVSFLIPEISSQVVVLSILFH